MTYRTYDPSRMDPEIYARGEAVVMTDLNSTRMEDFVRVLRALSGQPVDWHYMGGRAVIRCLGDRQRVIDAFKELLPFLAGLQRARWLADFPELYAGERFPHYQFFDGVTT